MQSLMVEPAIHWQKASNVMLCMVRLMTVQMTSIKHITRIILGMLLLSSNQTVQTVQGREVAKPSQTNLAQWAGGEQHYRCLLTPGVDRLTAGQRRGIHSRVSLLLVMLLLLHGHRRPHLLHTLHLHCRTHHSRPSHSHITWYVMYVDTVVANKTHMTS